MGFFSKSSKSTGHISVASRDGLSRGNRSRGAKSHGGSRSVAGRSLAGGSTRGSRSYKRMGADVQLEKRPLLMQHNRTQHSRNPKVVQNLSNTNIDLLHSKITSYREQSHRRERTGDRSMRQARSMTPSGDRSVRQARSTTPSGDRSRHQRRETRSTTPSGDRSRRESRSTIPRMIRTAIIASPTAPEPRSKSAEPSFRTRRSTVPIDLDTDRPAVRSRSVDPIMVAIRKSESIDLATSQLGSENMRSRSAEPATNRGRHEVVKQVRSSRSMSPSGLKSSDTSQTSLTSGQSRSQGSRSSERRDDATVKTRASEAIPYRLEKDMTYLADGMNLDKNTRCLLAAYDAKTIDDFYLMSDNDFAFLVQRANANNHSLPPLQVRKVRMLRRWLKEVVEDNITDTEDSERGVSTLRRNNFRLIPKDWKDQYKNDLPHLKLQLRQQGDSLFERIRVISDVLACGAGSIY